MPEHDKPTREEIDEKLAQALAAFTGRFAGRDAARSVLTSARRKNTVEVHRAFSLPFGPEYALPLLRQAVFQADTQRMEAYENGWLLYRLTAENLCLLYVEIAESQGKNAVLNISAYAKEGLIRQHTAEKCAADFEQTAGRVFGRLLPPPG
ncbi:MAG TPA: hypothetical protein PK597_00375 [Oscillospiraceae bacterium]|nr:hypothetical protein [Oscillospiraceae bacterium]